MRIASFFLFVSILLSPFAGALANATKNTCYKAINGKRYYTCKKATKNEKRPSAVVNQRHVLVKNAQEETVAEDLPSGYQNVPVLEASKEKIVVTQIEEKSDNMPSSYQQYEKPGSPGQYNRFGILLGRSSLLSTGISSALSYGLSFRSNINSRWDFNVRYSRQSSATFLNISTRRASSRLFSSENAVEDSSIATNLFSSELQYSFADRNKVVRPFAGAGLFYKNTKLEEKDDLQRLRRVPAAYLSRNSVGISSSTGFRYELEKQWQLNASLNFFLPIFNTASNSYSPLGKEDNSFTQEDKKILSSSVFQINLTAEYLF